MSFLNPLMLLALAAASIPLLLHLLNRRPGRAVPFSSIRFLEDLQQSRLRSLRFRQILLLLLRLGVVVFTVLAFSGPVVGSASGQRGRSVVLILDNTWSRVVGGEDRWREEAAELLRQLEPGDEYAIVPLSDPHRPEAGVLRREVDRGGVRLEQIGLGYRSAGYAAALRQAALLLETAGGTPEVVLLTDRQRINAEAATPAQVRFPAGTTIRVVANDAEQGSQNISIDSIHTGLRAGGSGYDVAVWLHNQGEERQVDVRLIPEKGGGDRKRITVPSGGRVDLRLRGSRPSEGAVAAGQVRIEDDPLDFDNRRWYTVALPPTPSVSVIADRQSRTTVARVVDLVPGIRVTEWGTAELSVDREEHSSVTIAVDPADLPVETARRLAEKVRGGGGLFLCGGPRLARAGATAPLLEALGLRLGRVVVPGDQGQPFAISRIARSHPLFAGVFDHSSGTRPPALDVRRLLPSSSGEPLIVLDNGEPLLVDIRVGSGRVLYLGLPLDRSWSDIAGSSLLVPLLLRGIAYLSETGAGGQSFAVGEQPVVPVQGSLREGAEVEVHGGEVGVGIVRQREGRPVAFLPQIDRPGNYAVVVQDDTLARFSVNGDPEESRGEMMSREELEMWLRGVVGPDVAILATEDAVAAADAVNAGGFSLWQYLVLAAILCALAELVVGRRAVGER